MTAVGFEPTPLRTGALSQRLRPLGQTVAALAGAGNSILPDKLGQAKTCRHKSEADVCHGHSGSSLCPCLPPREASTANRSGVKAPNQLKYPSGKQGHNETPAALFFRGGTSG